MNTALDSLRYDGKSSRITLDNHIARMRDIFTELDEINTKNANPDEQVNFSNRQKIDKLLKSIQVDHLNQVKDTIRLNPDRYRTFEEAVNDITLLHDEHRQERNKLKRTIAESGTRRPGGGKSKCGRVDKTRSANWIPKEKWAKMSEAEKKAHLLKVKKKKVEEDKRKIAELESETQEPSVDAAAGDTAGNEDEDNSNRRGTGSPHGRGGCRSWPDADTTGEVNRTRSFSAVLTVNLGRLVSEVGRNMRNTLEADSHADTMCAGANSKTIYVTDQIAHVFGYNGKKLDTEIVSWPIRPFHEIDHRIFSALADTQVLTEKIAHWKVKLSQFVMSFFLFFTNMK